MTSARFLVGATVAVFVSLSTVSAFAAEFQIPPNDGYVTDAAGIISAADKEALTTEINSFHDRTSNEIAIVTLSSLNGMDPSEAGVAIGRKWGVGSSKNNGILILIAYDTRDIGIEVGYGLEGVVPDIVAEGIRQTDMVPAFRSGEYGKGLLAAVQSLEKHIGGEYTADRYADHSEDQGALPYAFFIGFLVFQWLLAILGRTKSWWLGGVFGGVAGIILVVLYGWWLSIPALVIVGLLLDYVVSKNYNKRGHTSWWAGGGFGPGGGFGGSSGGGFGGFGGGSFGGGGAHGKW